MHSEGTLLSFIVGVYSATPVVIVIVAMKIKTVMLIMDFFCYDY